MAKLTVMDDKDLVRLYQNGNQQAITELVNRYKQRIFSTIYFLVKNRKWLKIYFKRPSSKLSQV